MKSGRIAVLAAATVLATASSVGAIGVGTASAQSYTYLCINNPAGVTYCAVADGSSAVKMETEKVGTTTNWYWPAYETPGTIEQADTTKCMQVDADGGDIVIEAACNTEPYQEWYNLGPDPYGDMQFQSEWNPNECLTYDADGAELKVGGCGPDWYQGFFPA